MELKLEGGRYLPSPFGGAETVSGGEERIQRILMKLRARRGGFAPLPDYGSRLHSLLSSVAPSQRAAAARQFAAEALEGESGLTVEEASVTESDGEALVRLTLTLDGESLSLILN